MILSLSERQAKRVLTDLCALQGHAEMWTTPNTTRESVIRKLLIALADGGEEGQRQRVKGLE